MSSNIRIQRICQHCGNEFTARTTQTKFCSHTCNSRSYKAKAKEAKIEQSNRETMQEKQKPIEAIKAKDFLSIADTCKLLGVSRWTVWRLVNRNELPSAKIGKRVLISRAGINSLFKV